MKITFLGASGTVTGSGYLLETDNNTKILIDFGMFQGTAQINAMNRDELRFDPSELDGVLLTHAHLDHCGRLPLLAQNGLHSPIYMTEATYDLTELVLYDSAKIARIENELDPLYTDIDVGNVLDLYKKVDYHKPFEVNELTIEYIDAGHLLGSASIIIKSENKTIVFSGDLGNSPQTIVKPTEYVDQADIVIMESTYGGRNHPKEDSSAIIADEINTVEAQKSALLIPSFALNKSQDIIYRIKKLKEKGTVNKHTPVFLDSPMAIESTYIHLKHKNLFNKELFNEENPFDFPSLIFTNKKGQGRKMSAKGAKVIIAGSGMMNGGRIVSHAQNYLPNKRNRLLIVGYQAEETMGREIIEGVSPVLAYGKLVQVNAHVNKIEGMSSHAGQDQLLNWLGKIKGTKKIFLTHGEDIQRSHLKRKIEKNLKLKDVTLPRRWDTIEI